jgi:protein-tyrosine phosphatase
MGNICRSPTAEGVARALAERAGVAGAFQFDSAGTHGYHIGAAPDERTCNHYDFVRFDHILAMDRANLELLVRACPIEHQHKLGLFLEFAVDMTEDEVPDPYYGGVEGFENVLDLIEAAANGLLDRLVIR